MSDRGGKGFSSTSKGKSLASRPGAPNGRQNNSANISYVTIDSDSDSEGFAEVTPIYSKSNGKAASESLKTGGKASSFSKGLSIQISRYIGDVYLKRPEYNKEPLHSKFWLRETLKKPTLSSEPAIAVHQIQPNDQFVIFASDGLWEHLGNQEAADLV